MTCFARFSTTCTVLKNEKNIHGGVLLLATLLHECIRRFINYTSGTESRKAAHIKIWRTQNLNITFLWNENRSWDLTIQKSCFCLLQWKPLVMWVNGLTKYVKLRRVALAFTLHKAFLENSLEVASPPHFVHFSRKLFLVIFY